MVIQKANVSAGSDKELQMRISELKKRGYEVEAILPVQRPEHMELTYDGSRRGSARSRDSYLGYERHKAVMQRDYIE